jgi:DNA-directed RNA polymerase omega subunit
MTATAAIPAISRDVRNVWANDWPGIASRFQLVILAGLRTKQLVQGARPRIATDRLKRKNIAIALEELRQGLIPFNTDIATESPNAKV